MKYFFRLVIASISVILLYLLLSDHYAHKLEEWGVPTKDELVKGVRKINKPTVEFHSDNMDIRFDIENEEVFSDGSHMKGTTRVTLNRHSNSDKMVEVTLSSISPVKDDGNYDELHRKVVIVDNEWIIMSKPNGDYVYVATITAIDSTSVANKAIELHFDSEVDEVGLSMEKIGIYPIRMTTEKECSYAFSDSLRYMRDPQVKFLAVRGPL